MNEPSRFGKFVQKATSPEAMAFGLLPLAGVLESIASRGQSPGTNALNQQKIVLGGIEDRRQREQQEEERKRKLAEEAMKKVLRDKYRANIPEEDRGNFDLAPDKYVETQIQESVKKPKTIVNLTDEQLSDLEPNERMLYDLDKPKFGEYWKSKMLKGMTIPSSDPNEVFQQEAKLRSEYADQAKEFVKVRDSYNRIEASAKDPSPAGDLALVFNYMKVLDPGSTVREGEFATAQNSAGIPGRIVSLYNNVLKGTRLNPDQRADFVGRAKGLYQRQLLTQKTLRKNYETLAKSYGLNAGNVIGGMVMELGDGASLGNGDNQPGQPIQPNQPNQPITPPQPPSQPQRTNRFNSLEEAERANLPKGTVIYIQGRKAVVE